MMAAATLLKELRAENKNVLYFDTGDVIMGGGESYYDLTVDIANQSLMAMMLDEMNNCGADYIEVTPNYDEYLGISDGN